MGGTRCTELEPLAAAHGLYSHACDGEVKRKPPSPRATIEVRHAIDIVQGCPSIMADWTLSRPTGSAIQRKRCVQSKPRRVDGRLRWRSRCQNVLFPICIGWRF